MVKQHQEEADAVDAHEIADAELREPGAFFHELHAGDAIFPADQQQQADQEGQDSGQQGNRFLGAVAAHQGDNQRAEEGQE